MDEVAVVPAEAELDGEGNRHGGADSLEDLPDQGQVAKQAAASVAGDDALGGAAEVQVDEIEAGVLDDACGVGQRGWIRAEELRGDRVFVVVEGEVALALRLAHASEAVGRGELGHDQAAAGLLVGDLGVDSEPRCSTRVASKDRSQGDCANLGHPHRRSRKEAGVADEAAKDGVGDPGHRREHCRRGDRHSANVEGRRDARMLWHGVFARVVPVLFHRSCDKFLFRHTRQLHSLHEKASAEAEAFLNPLERCYLAAVALPASEAAYLRRKRSTRPAVSTSFCLPVKNGWQAEQISTWMIALVGRAGRKVRAAGAHDANFVIVRVNSLFWHDSKNLSRRSF